MGTKTVIGFFIGVLIFLIIAIGFVGIETDGRDVITGRVLEDGDFSDVSRSFVGNVIDEDIVVHVGVTITPGFGHNVYVVEERVPSEFAVVNTGSATFNLSENTLKWSVIDSEGVSSSDLTYTVRTSNAGTYLFVGSYGIDGMDNEEAISGSSLVVNEQVIVDNEAPVYILFNTHYPPAYSPLFIDRVNIDVLWSDNIGVVDRLLEHNFGGVLVNSSGSSWSGTLGAGSYQWRSYAVDAAGNLAATPLQTFSIPKGDPNLVLELNGLASDISIGVGGSVNVIAGADKGFDLYENGVESSNGLRSYSSAGSYNFTVVVLEDVNYSGDFLTRFVNVAGVPSPVNITWNHSRWINEHTTDFDNVNLSGFHGEFRNGFGGINFLQNISIARNLNLRENIVIESGSIFVDSALLPEFNYSAELMFYGLSFVEPVVLRDGVSCSSCVIGSYSDGTLSVNVLGFSEYTVVEGYVAPSNSGSSSGGGGGSSVDYPEDEVLIGTYVEDPDCVADFSCGDWGKCVDGISKRVCSDSNDCSVGRVELKSCDSGLMRIRGDNVWIWIWILVVLILGIGVVIVFISHGRMGYGVSRAEFRKGEKVDEYVKNIKG